MNCKASLTCCQAFNAGVPRGYTLGADYRNKHQFKAAYFQEKIKLAKNAAIDTNKGTAYPVKLLNKIFEEAMPPGGYVTKREATDIVGWQSKSADVLELSAAKSFRTITAPDGFYARRKVWIFAADLIAYRENKLKHEREMQARREKAIKQIEAETKPCIQFEKEKPIVEQDLTTLEGLHARLAELYTRYNVAI